MVNHSDSDQTSLGLGPNKGQASMCEQSLSLSLKDNVFIVSYFSHYCSEILGPNCFILDVTNKKLANFHKSVVSAKTSYKLITCVVVA